jgi:AcrR family transcriptional regulator
MPTHDETPPALANGTEAEPIREARSLVPQTARGEATRQRILNAAEVVFGELGYYDASISEITRRAKVAQGTFYIYFHSKREIFVELIEELGRRLRADTTEASRGAGNRLDAERRGFVAFFRFAAQHRRIYQIVQEAERVAPEAARAYYRGISDGYARRLREASAAGDIRPIDPETVTFALMGIAHFSALRWILWDDDGDATVSPATVDKLFDFIAHGLEP